MTGQKAKKIREICTSGTSESGEFIQRAVAVKMKILYKSKLKGLPWGLQDDSDSSIALRGRGLIPMDAKRGVLLSKEKRLTMEIAVYLELKDKLGDRAARKHQSAWRCTGEGPSR